MGFTYDLKKYFIRTPYNILLCQSFSGVRRNIGVSYFPRILHKKNMYLVIKY